MRHTYTVVIKGKEVIITQRGKIDPSTGVKFRGGYNYV